MIRNVHRHMAVWEENSQFMSLRGKGRDVTEVARERMRGLEEGMLIL